MPVNDEKQSLIDQYLDGDFSAAQQSTAESSADSRRQFEHWSQTDADFAAEVRRQEAIRAVLKTLGASAPAAGLVDETLRFARWSSALAGSSRRKGFRNGMALAAAVGTLAVGGILTAGIFFGGAPAGSALSPLATTSITLPGKGISQVQTLALDLRVPAPIEGAIIRIELPDQIELEGYPAETVLEWRADLAAGVNRIHLPVLAFGADVQQASTLIAEIIVDDEILTYPFHLLIEPV